MNTLASTLIALSVWGLVAPPVTAFNAKTFLE
jgi:hypothetical protein